MKCCWSVAVSNSLWLHELEHASLLCPLLSPRVSLSSCPLSWWAYLTISFSVTPFSFCLQSFPASGSFPMSRLFLSGGQSIGASTSSSVLMNIQDGFPLGWTGLISLQSKGLSQESSQAPHFKSINSSTVSLPYGPTLISVHDYWKTVALTIRTFVSKVISLLFNMLFIFVIVFLPKSVF